MIAFIAGGWMVGQRGMALLMTMILITVIGSIAFGVGRTTLSNLRQVNRLEDSLNAYQAAQAGIEDALLRFRFDKNAEAPKANSCLAITNNPTPIANPPPQSPDYFSRVDISTPALGACVDLHSPSIETPPPDHIVYDLKMSYKKAPTEHECIMTSKPNPPADAPGCQQTTKPAALDQDTAVEYDVHTLQGSLNINVTFADQAAVNAALEVIPLDQDGKPIDSSVLLLRPADFPKMITQNSVMKTIRFRSFGSALSKFDLWSSVQSDTMDSRLTQVDSIGYFGASKRKLHLTLDRLTGTIFEVFDFVLFSGSGDITGPEN